MEISAEQSHYENPSFWTNFYLEDEAELRRFATSAAMIPDSVTSLLDVGTGNGAFLAYLEEHRPDIRLEGLERSRTAIDHALSRAPIRRGSIDSMPYGDRSIECLTCLEVVEHIPYGVYEAALAEIARVSARYVIVSVPFKEDREVGRVRCTYCACEFDRNYHMRTFDEQRMRDLFPGFRTVELRTVPRYEYVFFHALYRFRDRLSRRLRGDRSLPTSAAICPQCGYQPDVPPVPAAQPPARSPLRERLKAMVPKRPRPSWIVGLYERAEKVDSRDAVA